MAHVSARAFNKPSPQGPWMFVVSAEVDNVSDDLPAWALGPIIAGVIEKAWKMGFKPTSIRVIVQFS